MKCSGIILSFLVLFNFCEAQVLTLQKHLTTKDGLPSNQVYSAHRDTEGFIWLSTDVGVSRYNGVYFKNFTTYDGLVSNDIFSCYEDKFRRIWFSTFNGKLCYFKNNKFYNAENTPWINKADSISNMITNFIPSDSGVIVLFIKQNEGNKLSYFEILKNEVIKKPINLGHNEGKISTLRFLAKNKYSAYFTSVDGNFLSIKKVAETKIETIEKDISFLEQRSLPANNGNDLLLSHKNKLLNMMTDEHIPIKIPAKDIYGYLKYKNKEFFGTKNGLVIQENNILNRYLENEFITSITLNNFKQLIATSYKNGIYIFNLSNKKNNTYQSIPNRVTPQLRYKGLTFCTIDKKFITALDPEQNYKAVYKSNTPILANSLHRIKDTFVTTKLTILTNTLLWDKDKFVTISSSNIEPSQTEYNVFKKAIQCKKKLFYNGGGSIAQSNITSKKRHIVKGVSQNNRVFWLAKHQDNLYLSRRDLFQQVQGDTVAAIPHLSKLELRSFDFSNNRLVGININNDLIIVDQFLDSSKVKNKIVINKAVRLKKISPSKFIIQLSTGYNKLVTITTNGYEIQDPIFELSRTPINKIESDSLSLFIYDQNQTTIYPLQSITKPSWKPIASLREINNDVEVIDPKQYERIPYTKRNDISVNFEVLSKVADGVTYDYAVIDGDKDTNWIESKLTTVRLIQLGYGEYNVLFRAKNQLGVYSNIAEAKLCIQKPFYLTWWFLLLTAILLLSLGLFISNRRQRIKIEEERIKNETEVKFLKAEFKSLNAVMNPHFIFNSLNNIQGFINSNDKEKANQYLEIFSKLVRQNMKNVDQGLISLEKELALVKNYLILEKMRMGDKLNFTFNIPENIDTSEIEVPPLTIQPIVENSIKHGIFPLQERSGHIEITLTEKDDLISIIVIDNGVGFSKSKKSTNSNSIGLLNTQKRFDNLSKILGKELNVNIEDIKVNDKIVGTKANITIKEESADT